MPSHKISDSISKTNKGELSGAGVSTLVIELASKFTIGNLQHFIILLAPAFGLLISFIVNKIRSNINETEVKKYITEALKQIDQDLQDQNLSNAARKRLTEEREKLCILKSQRLIKKIQKIESQ